MIEIRDLVKTFDGFRALDGVTLTVPAGAVYGLVGPNGAGKSTLIRHLAGVMRPDLGDVTVGGEGVWENPAVKARAAVIPDDIYFFPQASTREMMRFYRGLYPGFDPDRYERLRPVFPEVDEKRPIRRLSKGLQKQSAFWLALCRRPDILVLDEPVDGLDPVMRRQIWSLVMGDVAERGTTVLVSSHNLRELEDVCDHVGIMNHGKMLIERSLDELQDSIVKLQVVLPDGVGFPERFEVLSRSDMGHVATLIIRGRAAEITGELSALRPLLLDALPLTLEEIFIYELGGADYAVKNVIL